MIGMDEPVKLEESKVRDSLCSDPIKPDGEAEFCSHNCELKQALVDNGKLDGKKLAALCPITPNPCRENGDQISLSNSPLSSDSPKSPNVDGFTSTESDGVLENSTPRTPVEGIFDPFAPGPEELLLAPLCKKHVKGCRNIVARRLNFEDDDDNLVISEAGENAKEVEILCEKTILDTVYGTLLEAIVEDFLAENQSELPLVEAPTSSPPHSFTGIAETCPRAPMKAITTKSRNIDPGLCRKLEF